MSWALLEVAQRPGTGAELAHEGLEVDTGSGWGGPGYWGPEEAVKESWLKKGTWLEALPPTGPR